MILIDKNKKTFSIEKDAIGKTFESECAFFDFEEDSDKGLDLASLSFLKSINEEDLKEFLRNYVYDKAELSKFNEYKYSKLEEDYIYNSTKEYRNKIIAFYHSESNEDNDNINHFDIHIDKLFKFIKENEIIDNKNIPKKLLIESGKVSGYFSQFKSENYHINIEYHENDSSRAIGDLLIEERGKNVIIENKKTKQAFVGESETQIILNNHKAFEDSEEADLKIINADFCEGEEYKNKAFNKLYPFKNQIKKLKRQTKVYLNLKNINDLLRSKEKPCFQEIEDDFKQEIDNIKDSIRICAETTTDSQLFRKSLSNINNSFSNINQLSYDNSLIFDISESFYIVSSFQNKNTLSLLNQVKEICANKDLKNNFLEEKINHYMKYYQASEIKSELRNAKKIKINEDYLELLSLDSSEEEMTDLLNTYRELKNEYKDNKDLSLSVYVIFNNLYITEDNNNTGEIKTLKEYDYETLSKIKEGMIIEEENNADLNTKRSVLKERKNKFNL